MPDGPRPAAASASQPSLAATADALVGDTDFTELFERLVSACVDLIGAGGAALMIIDHRGELQLVASSSQAMAELAALELATGHGPGRDCFAGRELVAGALGDAEAAQRWPGFTAAARKHRFAGVQALPLRIHGEAVGALTLVHAASERLPDVATELVQALADLATVAILQHQALTRQELLSRQLQAALTARIVIEQAKGLLAERGQLSVDEAFAKLRGYCRSARLPLTRTARELISGTRDLDTVLAPQGAHRP